MMKKLCCILLVLCMLPVPVLTSAIEPIYSVQYVKLDKAIDWPETYNCIAKDTDTGNIIPLSYCDGNYVYAYIADGTGIEPYMSHPEVFQDVSDWLYLEDLTIRGIIQGNENYEFQPDKPLTNAEMAAIFCRLDETPVSPATDKAWYDPYIETMQRKGIIGFVDPEQAVTRKDLIYTACLYLFSMDALAIPSEEQAALPGTIQDLDGLPSNMLRTYQALWYNQYNVMMEYEYQGELEDIPVALKPDEIVPRLKAAEFISQLLDTFMRRNLPAIPKDNAVAFELDETMPRIDGSTSSYPITNALYDALFTNGNNHPLHPASHTKTITSYKRLIAGEADIILVPDPNSEVKALAAQEGVELSYIPIASEALIFFTGKDNSLGNLTSEQIKEIYLNNSYTNWSQLGGPDAPFAAFCRNNDSGSHAQMERFFLNGQEINGDIRRERTSVMMASILTDVQDYEQQNLGTFALGYSMYYYYQNAGMVLGTENLKLLSVDGVTPTAESIKDRTYPLSTNYYAVIRADTPEDAPARRLISWLQSAEGKQCIIHAGFGA